MLCCHLRLFVKFATTFALSGNGVGAYVRRQDIISPLVDMAVGVVPLPSSVT